MRFNKAKICKWKKEEKFCTGELPFKYSLLISLTISFYPIKKKLFGRNKKLCTFIWITKQNSMDSNDDFIKTLLQKEDVLLKQLEGLRTTISLFRGDGFVSQNGNNDTRINEDIPSVFSEAMTWNAKVLFAVNKLGHAFVTDIVDELKKFMPDTDKDFLLKRVTTVASTLKKGGKLKAKAVGIRSKYSIK